MDHCLRDRSFVVDTSPAVTDVSPQTGLPTSHAGLENIECVPRPKAGDRRGIAEQRLRHIQVRQPRGKSRESGRRSQRSGYSAAKWRRNSMLSVLSICPLHSPTSATTPSSVSSDLRNSIKSGGHAQSSLLNGLIQHSHQPAQSGELPSANTLDPGLGDRRGSPASSSRCSVGQLLQQRTRCGLRRA